MSGWPASGSAVVPDGAGSWKNFAMSQSPPSWSPIRKRKTASESGSEEGTPNAAGGVPTPCRAAAPVEAARDDDGASSEAPEADELPQGGAEASDAEGSAAEGEAEASEQAPGIQCLQQPPGGEESEDEESAQGEAAPPEVQEEASGEEEEMQEEVQPDVNMEVKEEASGEEEEEEMQVEPAAEAEDAPEQEASAEEEASGGEEEAQQQTKQPAFGAPLQLVQAPEDSGEEEEEADEEEQPAQPADGSLALVAAAPAEADSLVPAEEEIAMTQIVATQHSETFGGALPSDTTQEWTVSADFCSVVVSGKEMKLPRSVYDRLYGYQRSGVAWMWGLYQKGFGGLLADEMGLGKTVQCAAFLACLKCTEQASRFLIVTPVTLLEQWKRELQTWTKDTGLAVHVMHGSVQDRRKALRGMVTKGGALLISYDLVRNCISYIRTSGLACSATSLPKKRKRKDGRAVHDDDSPDEAGGEDMVEESDQTRPWDVVIVDEAHALKNPSCVSGRALRKLESRSRFLLTGTPLQNKLGDLWALMDFSQPGLLGNHATFERNFSDQIAKGSKRNATRFAVELKDHLARELKRLTAPHFLRRMKSEVGMLSAEGEAAGEVAQELPSKMDVVLWLNLTPAQQELYNLYLNSDIVRRATGDSKCGMEALRAIALLKKLCNHPLMNLPADEFNQWRNQMAASGGGDDTQCSQTTPCAAASSSSSDGALVAMEDAGDFDADDMSTQPAPEMTQVLPRLRALLPGSVQGATLLSCKLRVLSVLLPQLQKRGHRCLIFSQSTRMLDLIQACVLRVLGLKFLRIDGSIEAKDRDLKISKFQQEGSKYFCVCLSIQVGGTGLTITGADRVILVDPAWNPSVDAQAIDRVHRIGQKRDVVVYRLIASAAIEDKMFRLQVFKRALSKTYLEQEQQVRFFTNKDLKQLFEPPNQSTSTQSLMAEQIGTEALEHEDLLRVVANDIGSTDDPQALPFWQSSDVLGFSDYQRLFMFLEQSGRKEEAMSKDAVRQAQDTVKRLKTEEYVKDQVVDGKFRAHWREVQAKENLENEAPEALPLQDA